MVILTNLLITSVVTNNCVNYARVLTVTGQCRPCTHSTLLPVASEEPSSSFSHSLGCDAGC
ncbi:hypothetical protein M758_UG105700 [Ceratodon purpureus]|nr:hypothetical protein M758_UG105700 [Ceratodon purpureus]